MQPDVPIDKQALWFISPGRYTSGGDAAGAPEGAPAGPVRHYRVSDLGRYLVDGASVEVPKRLVGCEIRTPLGLPRGLNRRLRYAWRRLRGRVAAEEREHCQLLECDAGLKPPVLTDPRLQAHVTELLDQTRPHDPAVRALANLTAGGISDIVGLCEDVGGHRTWLQLDGTVTDKIGYLRRHMGSEIPVVLTSAHLNDGLYEMRGFDFAAYDGRRGHRLVGSREAGRNRFRLFDAEDASSGRDVAARQVRHLQLFEQALRANANLAQALETCRQGRATALKVFINRELEIDYTQGALPAVYREVLQACNLGDEARQLLMPSLNRRQLTISFSFLPRQGPGRRLVTHVSVLHDIRALDDLRTRLPELYGEIRKRAPLSEAGRYYLLDAIRGYKHV